ncbi:MAG: MBL fold metallo-hydrolase [Eubacteriales bacterium]
MKINFFGAARFVTGSSYMVETKKARFLVDCGMRQGADEKRFDVPGSFPFNAGDIDFVVLTHAHIDHSGYLPLLVKRGFSGKIYATSASAELCSIMLPDSGHIQEMDVEWKNRKRMRAGKPIIPPLYTVEDANKTLKCFSGMEYGEVKEVAEGISICFQDAGHLLGSGSAEIWVTEDNKTEKVVFSGDIGNRDKPIIKDPTYMQAADYVVMESTYGNRLHENLKPSEEQLRDVLKAAVKRGGNIVIPAFAVGRTQETLYDIALLLKDKSVPGLENMPVYIDSPLGIKATDIFDRCFKNYYDAEAMALKNKGIEFLNFDTLNVAKTADESKAINFLDKPAIIISSSGMCDAGRIKHHLKHNLWKDDATVIFVGYQALGTTGRAILDGADSVKIFGDRVMINAKIERIEGLSGHADKAGLLKWINEFDEKPKKVFITHGEEQVALSFAEELKKQGFDVQVPIYGEVFDTKDMSSFMMAKAESIQAQMGDQETEYRRAISIIRRYMSANDPNSDDVKNGAAFMQDIKTLVDKWGIKG